MNRPDFLNKLTGGILKCNRLCGYNLVARFYDILDKPMETALSREYNAHDSLDKTNMSLGIRQKF